MPSRPAVILRSVWRARLWLALAPVHAYRRLFFWLPKSCRYEPSCSRYMLDAVLCHGLFKGIVAGSWRILRCNPYGRGGPDPAEAFAFRWRRGPGAATSAAPAASPPAAPNHTSAGTGSPTAR